MGHLYKTTKRTEAAAAADRESMNWDSLTCLSLCGSGGATIDTSGLVLVFSVILNLLYK